MTNLPKTQKLSDLAEEIHMALQLVKHRQPWTPETRKAVRDYYLQVTTPAREFGFEVSKNNPNRRLQPFEIDSALEEVDKIWL